ncbi:MAG: glycosyltransferase, partial [Methyloprofundus sp.]|nr:glycosyltransferase [Methyloprofundus sp.]
MAIAREKIALAVPSFSGGGAERVMVILANKFIEFGYSVDFIVGLDKGPYKKLLSKEVNKIVLAEESQGRVTKRFSAVSVLRRYLRDSDSFVLMSTIREFNVFVGFVKVFSRSKKHVFFREAASLDDSHFSGSWPKKIKLFLMRYFYKRVDGIIANSNATRDDLKKYLSLDGAKIASIYNPLDKVQCLSKKVSIKIVAAGRLVPNKNFPDLIKSLPHVKEKYP